MARSYRTDPAPIISRRRTPAMPAPCRIIERRPTKGDIHPVTAQQLRRMITRLPGRYFYGLTSIEFLPRRNAEIGHPYGVYRPGERSIQIFSLPFPDWRMPATTTPDLFEMHGARLQPSDEALLIHWPRLVDLAYFVYHHIILHELGHHTHNRYRTKRPHPKLQSAEETSADRHALRLAKNSAFQEWWDD